MKSGKIDNSQLIKLKNKDYLDKQKIAAVVLKETMQLLSENYKKLSLLELDKLAGDNIIKNNCIPTFKNYKGFPGNICISVNNQLVHGIPKDYYLKQNDIVTFDFGVTYLGAIVDSARTFNYDNKDQKIIDLINTTKKCLKESINQIKIGDNIGTIGYTINKIATNNLFNVITNYGGHGLCWNTAHAQPFISNKSNKDEGIRIVPGLTIAIEPLLCIGNPKTFLDKDGWTVYTQGMNCHEEDSIFITENGVEILT